jgi:hypothetical protein
MNLASRAALLVLPASLAAACIHSSDHHHLIESEPNDGACCADYFGKLSPGEFLSIEASITDDGFDPYDGFAFTATEPISVEFRVYADKPYADLDVCLYDPQLGITVDCFQSPYDPEIGVAHVLAGGAEFHLVVNSFVGDTAYTLQLEAFPLFLASEDAPATSSAIVGDGHDAAEKPDRAADFAAYHGADGLSVLDRAPAVPALVGLGELYLLDEVTGDLSTAFLAATSEGTLVWMGNPDEADAGEGR